MKFRIKHLLLIPAIVLALGAVADYAVVAICDGGYDLTVELDAESAVNVSSVSYLGVNRPHVADSIIASIDDNLKFMERQESVDPFVIRVGHSCRRSLFGRTWGHVQEYSHIVVVLHHPDGSRTIHRLTVPDRKQSRRVVVEG
jgi:hypothetical protein